MRAEHRSGTITMSDPTLKKRLNTIIFGIDTPAGRRFDLVLIWGDSGQRGGGDAGFGKCRRGFLQGDLQ